MSIGVYQIEINGKKYIGSAARSISRRWSNHLSELRRGIHGNTYLQRTFNKYGEDNLCFSIIEVVENPEDCVVIEQKYIDTLHPELNLCLIAGSPLGRKHSEETRQRIGIASRGRKHSAETKAKMSAATSARPLSKDSRAKQAASIMGHPVSAEARAKISAARTGMPSSMKGKKHTEEAKAKMSAAKKGITTWNKGIPHTEESKKKMSEARKKYYQDRRLKTTSPSL